MPETIRVDLTGALPPWVTAKDLSLWLLQLLGPEAGIYRALEFGGPGLAGLSIESRMVHPEHDGRGGRQERLSAAGRRRSSSGWRERLRARATGDSRPDECSTERSSPAGALYPRRRRGLPGARTPST